MGKSDIYEPEGTTLHVESRSPSRPSPSSAALGTDHAEDAVLRVPSPCSSGTTLQSAMARPRRHGVFQGKLPQKALFFDGYY